MQSPLKNRLLGVLSNSAGLPFHSLLPWAYGNRGGKSAFINPTLSWISYVQASAVVAIFSESSRFLTPDAGSAPGAGTVCGIRCQCALLLTPRRESKLEMDPKFHHTLAQPAVSTPQAAMPQASWLPRNKFRHESQRGSPLNSLIHDRGCEVVGPSRGVVVAPEAGIDLRDDDLPIRGAELVNFLGK